MPGFDKQSAERIAATVKSYESRLRNPRGHRARYAHKRMTLVKFELLEALTQWSGDIVQAARKTWDPTAADGNGGYTVDCDDIVYVADFNEVGHNAGVGGYGAAEMHARQNSPQWVGTIVDLCCPGEEQGSCGGSA